MSDSQGGMVDLSAGYNHVSNVELMRRAREKLTGKWGFCAGVTLVYILLTSATSSIQDVGGLVSLILTGPISLGFSYVILGIMRGKDVRFGDVFSGFNRFVTAMVTHLLMALFIILWALLLIIPGIMAGLSYSMAYFILIDNEDATAMDALRMSKNMMYGHRWRLFCLGLRFIGWGILCLLTLGIGFLWLVPYVNASFALFYEDLTP